MEVLEKIAVSEEIITTAIDHRGKPERNSEYWPIIGLILAKIHQRQGKITILDSSKIKPKYFFRGVAAHVPALIVGLSYIGSNINNYFKN